MKDLDLALDVAREAAEESGKMLMDSFGRLGTGQIRLKGTGDYVTDLDQRSEEAIIRRIKKAFPGHRIVAEESGADIESSECSWYIDPLDGTANYVQGIPVFSVSIALCCEGQTRMGVIHHPHMREMFWAVQGKGAFLNGRPIRVSSVRSMEGAMIATGFPWRAKDHLDVYLEAFRRVFLSSAGLRRMGSAAIDLAYTACGRFEGFWEMKLHPWDVAAGALMVREAGGTVADFRGEDRFMESGNVVAGNPDIAACLLEVTRRTLSGVD